MNSHFVMLLPMFGWGDLNPLNWLGDAATEAVGQSWTAAMVAAWSSGLWILSLAFRGVDAFTSPDLTAGGPMHAVYPYTFGLGLLVALVMGFAQIGLAAVKRDGASVARVMVGVAQFGAVWLGYVGVASALVMAASGLTHGLLEGLLGIHGFSGYRPGSDWPRDVTDATTATVLGVCAWLLIWPAAIAYLLIMLVREAALLLLAATSPIAAAGLMSELGRTWFWRSLRWFVAALLIAPLAALVLGVGQKISEGVVSGAGDDTTAAVGMAVVGSLLVLVGALCPLILFRLLAFVEPGTSSGAAMRTALVAHGGVSGLLSGGGRGAGAAASRSDGAGRSAGEASADSATAGRFAASGSMAGALGAAGAVMAGVGNLAQGAVSVSSDVLSTSGVGHQHQYYPQYVPDRSGTSHHGSGPGPEPESVEPIADGDPPPPGATGAPPEPVVPPMPGGAAAAPVGPVAPAAAGEAGSAAPAAAL